jgi:hypothetical protein
MSWLSRIFGGNSGGEQAPAKPAAAAEIEHRGFTIRAEPYRSEGGQFQTAGTILKEIGGETRTHGFVRADRFATLDDAVAMSLQKGRQIVDEQGDKAFAQQSAKPV